MSRWRSVRSRMGYRMGLWFTWASGLCLSLRPLVLHMSATLFLPALSPISFLLTLSLLWEMARENPAEKALGLLRSRLCDPNFAFKALSHSDDSNYRSPIPLFLSKHTLSVTLISSSSSFFKFIFIIEELRLRAFIFIFIIVAASWNS